MVARVGSGTFPSIGVYLSLKSDANADPNIQFEFIVTAKDTVGNTVSTLATGESLSSGKAFVIRQETDRPVITLNNANVSVTEESKIKAGTNLFGTTSNNTLSFTIKDDDGISGYRVTVKHESDSTANETKTITDGFTNTPTSTSPSYKFPAKNNACIEGVYINVSKPFEHCKVFLFNFFVIRSINNICCNWSIFWTNLHTLLKTFIFTTVESVKQSFCKVSAGTEELHFLTSLSC